MQLDLLKRRAENLFSVSNTSLPHQLRVVPLGFRCAGNITSVLVVAKINTETTFESKYPEIEIWATDSLIFQHTRQARQEIRLNPGDFSPDGVLQYNLNPPLPIQDLNILGVYQPEPSQSVVQLFYADDPTATYLTRTEPENYERINSFAPQANQLVNQSILILPMTGS